MIRTVDARGLNCPQPVILTKRVMDENSGEEIVTLVNSETSLENVCKLAASRGYVFVIEKQGPDNHIHMTKQEADESAKSDAEKDLAIMVKSQYFGQGDDELGAALMKSFFYTLTEMGPELKHLIFMNGGIHLTTEESPILDHLQFLQQKGVQILSCGTCLDFYGKKDQLLVGQVTNMYNGTEILTNAGKTIVL
ncbi:MAG: sulfurtransferase-like selenium metabolism protein YedF [Syntrophomonadaceae bacterium]|jgi:selenium metabolism protein YedF|nr:sulfurtransferase-like selenium metabolism protein YedF [Syntrophomonadaceae bacterium]